MQEKIDRELKDLAETGRNILQTNRFANDRINRVFLNSDQIKFAEVQYAKFKTRGLNLIGKSFGIDDDHYKQLQALSEEFANYPACLGIVEAAVYAFDSGLLFNLKSLLAAELLGDFIDQAEALHAAGYHMPAASLAGAVLEDTLRKMWAARKWEIADKTNINTLSVELGKAGVYNSLTQKQIVAHADIRNNADHVTLTGSAPQMLKT